MCHLACFILLKWNGLQIALQADFKTFKIFHDLCFASKVFVHSNLMQWISIRDTSRCMTSANTSQMLSRRLFDDGQCPHLWTRCRALWVHLHDLVKSPRHMRREKHVLPLSVSVSDTFEGTNHCFKMCVWSGRAESTPDGFMHKNKPRCWVLFLNNE